MTHKQQSNRPLIGVLVLLFLVALLGLQKLLKPIPKQTTPHPLDDIPTQKSELTQLPSPPEPSTTTEGNPSFIYAAQKATPCVVHITAKYSGRTVKRGNSNLEDVLKELFGEGFDMGPREYKSKPSSSLGSGVLISTDGYVVTNNHVIDGADEIEITLHDNHRYKAKLIGTDPDTDLALLKIEETNLPYLHFGNSDALQVGEWVLAVGNPFNLTSTVTKGIVSAKARRADLAKTGGRITIESFIQTDAAMNPGNSGGALVTIDGKLVGINTAISTPTGTFAGYSFTIPSSIVQRVVSDLKKYGAVQRAVLGIFPTDVNADLVAEKKLKRFDGVYVVKFSERSAAAEAGLHEGDVIIGINNSKIKNLAQLHESLAHYQPGDEVKVIIDRNGKEITLTVKLRSAINEIKIARGQQEIEIEGATFEAVSPALKQKMGLKNGVQIKTIKSGKWQQAGIKKGFIVLSIDKEAIESIEQLATVLNSKKGGILVEGIYPNAAKAYYGLGWGEL